MQSEIHFTHFAAGWSKFFQNRPRSACTNVDQVAGWNAAAGNGVALLRREFDNYERATGFPTPRTYNVEEDGNILHP